MAFFFNADAGETPESAARARALAAQIMGQSQTPRSLGEGLTALGRGIAANVWNQRADATEAAGEAGANPLKERLMAALTGQAAPQPSAPANGGDFLSNLVSSESGGNWNALNNEGYGGRLQFGDARLADAAAAGVIPAGMTGADFSMQSPEVQQAVEQWHFGDIDQQAKALGLDKYYGQTIGGVPINAESVRAMAHLGGIGGAQQFIASGGKYNPADSNGTNLSDYGARFGGGGAPSGGLPMDLLMEAASNPWLMNDPATAAMVNSALEQHLQQSDPMYRLQMQGAQQDVERGALELNAMRNPRPEPGFTMLTPDESMALNLPQGAYQKGPDGKIYEIGGGGQTINVNAGQGEVGTIPQDYQLITDPTTGARRMEVIPGSKTALEQAAAADAAAAGDARQSTVANIVSEDIDRALALLEGDAAWTTGPLGQLMGNIKGSGADRLDNLLSTIRANTSFDRLQAMREASPTGGALGSVTENELRLLQDSVGSLERSNANDLAYNLKRVQQIYNDIVNGPQGSAAPAGPLDINALLEKYQ